jgi:hypothetical protein
MRRIAVVLFSSWLATTGVLSGCGASDDGQGESSPVDTDARADTDTDLPADTDTDTAVAADTADTADTDPGTTPDALHGETPAVNLPVPTFTEVLAMDGTARASANLVGQPSVVWFYPAAFTGG